MKVARRTYDMAKADIADTGFRITPDEIDRLADALALKWSRSGFRSDEYWTGLRIWVISELKLLRL